MDQRQAAMVETVRSEFIAANEMSLKACRDDGMLSIPDEYVPIVAARMIDRLSMHTLLKILSGLVPQQPPDDEHQKSGN